MFFFGAEIAFANEIFIENGTERAEMYPKLILFFFKVFILTGIDDKRSTNLNIIVRRTPSFNLLPKTATNVHHHPCLLTISEQIK